MTVYLLMMEVVILPLHNRHFLHAMAIGLLAFFWVSKMVILKRWIWRRTPLDLPIALFLIWALLSSILSTHPHYSIGEFRTEAVTYFFFFYLVVNQIRDRADIKKILLALMVGSALMASYGIYEYLAQGGNWTNRIIRIGSLTSDYNYASTYFILAIPVILYFLSESLGKPVRFFLFSVLFLMNVFSLYFTFSRAAWLGLVVSSIVLSFFLGKRAILTVSFGLGTILVLLFMTPQGKAFYANMGGSSEQSRMPAWEFGIGEIVKHPLVGIGYGRKNMRATFPEQVEMYNRGLIHLHNVFLETALEMGIPGGGFLIVLMVSLIVRFTTGYRRSTDPSDAWLMAVMTMTVSAYFTRNQFDHIYVDAPAVLFWILMGLGISRLPTLSSRTPILSELTQSREMHLKK